MIGLHARAGVDIDLLATRRQQEGARAFVESWNELLEGIARKVRGAGDVT